MSQVPLMTRKRPSSIFDYCRELQDDADIAQNKAAFVREQSRTLRERSLWLSDRRRQVLARIKDLRDHH